jgi:CheY-like chemotaxis protein
MQGDYEKSLVAGMNDHVTKPIDVDELYRTFFKWAQFGQARKKDLLKDADGEKISRES